MCRQCQTWQASRPAGKDSAPLPASRAPRIGLLCLPFGGSCQPAGGDKTAILKTTRPNADRFRHKSKFVKRLAKVSPGSLGAGARFEFAGAPDLRANRPNIWYRPAACSLPTSASSHDLMHFTECKHRLRTAEKQGRKPQEENEI